MRRSPADSRGDRSLQRLPAELDRCRSVIILRTFDSALRERPEDLLQEDVATLSAKIPIDRDETLAMLNLAPIDFYTTRTGCARDTTMIVGVSELC